MAVSIGAMMITGSVGTTWAGGSVAVGTLVSDPAAGAVRTNLAAVTVGLTTP